MAIRWNNVPGQNGTRGAALALMASNQAADRAFQSGKNVIDGMQKGQDDRYDYQKTQNNLGAQTLLSSYATPQAMQAAVNDGSFATKLAAFGSNIDPKYGLTGAQTQINNLRKQEAENETYQQGQYKLAAAPVINTYQAMIEDGSTEKDYADFIADLANRKALSDAGGLDDFYRLTSQDVITDAAASETADQLARTLQGERTGRAIAKNTANASISPTNKQKATGVREKNPNVFNSDGELRDDITSFDAKEALNSDVVRQLMGINLDEFVRKGVQSFSEQFPSATTEQLNTEKNRLETEALAQKKPTALEAATISEQTATLQLSTGIRNNIFYGGEDASPEEYAAVWDKVAKTPEFQNAMDNADFAREVNALFDQYSTQGIKIGDSSLRIPPAQMGKILRDMRTSWFELDEYPQENFNNLIQSAAFIALLCHSTINYREYCRIVCSSLL